MIDTVILTIPETDFALVAGPTTPSWMLSCKQDGFETYTNHQTLKQKQDDIYRPRTRIIKRGLLKCLQIEFSLPKLILGNNLDEVCEKDFSNILHTLQKRLREIGIIVSIPNLKVASVSVFHPSKNIVLSDGYTASSIIKELKKINLTKKMDLNRDSFRNDGQSLQLYTNSHSLVIYDKMQDLKKPKKRAIDKDRTPLHKALPHQLGASQKIAEVLRIEVRLANKVKMNQVLVKNGFKKNPTFEEAFKEHQCQKIVSQYWNELIVQPNLFLFSLANNPKQMLKNLIQACPNIKPKEIIYLIGLDALAKDEDGIRELRGYLERQGVVRTWYRIAKDTQKLNKTQNPLHCHAWIKQAENQIKDYNPLRVNDLLCKE